MTIPRLYSCRAVKIIEFIRIMKAKLYVYTVPTEVTTKPE